MFQSPSPCSTVLCKDASVQGSQDSVLLLHPPPVGPKGAHGALCLRCADTPFWTQYPPMAKVTVVATVFPYTGLPRLSVSPDT